jgi:AcrR family transcriptional regulator
VAHELNLDSKVRPLRERLREETSRAITEAAEEVFAQRGLREARMEEIAQRAGVSVGTLYNHFQDRNALANELIESRRKELGARLDAALAASAKFPFALQLRTFARMLFEHFEVHRRFLTIMLECDTARIEQPSPGMLEMRARGEALVNRGVRQGVLRPQGKELWPSFLMGAVKSLLIYELRYPGKLPIDQRIEALVNFFLKGAGA